MDYSNKKAVLYALLVAIDHYNPPVPPLKGCVNDLNKMVGYLQKKETRFNVKIKKLINEQATKVSITEQFNEHLAQASNKNGDVALFYYSGHGTQEEADPLFWPIEEDRKLEALVCFDSYTKQNGGKTRLNLLADKELRYLIRQVAESGVHVLTIFDCCHSGGNTRNGYIAERANNVRERRFINRSRLSQAFPVREWQDFIFSEEISYEKAQKQPITQLLPEGKHIQMAACQNDQSAFEVSGEGVFTKNLLDVLERCEGEVTYYDLQSRIQNFIKNQFDQTPRIYISGGDESGLFQGFLNKDVQEKPLYGNVNFNPDLGWIMDIGAMHGISSQSSNVKVRTLNEQNEYTAKIDEVYPSYSQIVFEEPEENQPDKTSSYKGFISDYFSTPIGVYLNISQNSLQKKLLEQITGKKSALNVMETDYEADYCIQSEDDQLYITRPGTPDIPVVRPVKTESDSDLAIIKNYLVHLSQYEFIKNLHNPNTYLFAENPVELRVFKESSGGDEAPVSSRNDELSLEYTRQNDDWGGNIRIALKNRTDRKLYCALLYLSFNFGVSTKLLKGVTAGIEPNQEVWAMEGAPIGLTLEDELKVYNYKESRSYLKLIISTSDFKQQATRFEMPPLPKPVGPASPGTRGLEIDTYNPGNIEDWTTRLVTIRIKNPFFSG